MAVFRCFFWKKKVFLAKRSTFTYSMSYIFWKLLFQRLILAINEVFLSILKGVRILLTHCNRIKHKIWHLVIIKGKRGRFRMIICKRPVPLNNHLQEAGPNGWSFAKGRSLQVIICKRLVHPNNHLQSAGPSRWTFARGRSMLMIIYKRPVHPDDHLQEVGPSEWLRRRRKRRRKRQRRRRRRRKRKIVADGRDGIEGSIRGPRRPKKITSVMENLHWKKHCNINGYFSFME